MSTRVWLRNLLGIARPKPITNLSEDEVHAIAVAAAPEWREYLVTQQPVEAEGRVIWTVMTLTKGSGVAVTIDDMSAKLVGVSRYGPR